jgi:hypothetical protein
MSPTGILVTEVNIGVSPLPNPHTDLGTPGRQGLGSPHPSAQLRGGGV